MKRPLDALYRLCLVRKLLVPAVYEHACIDFEHDDGAVTVERTVDAEKV
jgi:hypothetical protein